jgi:hypothetical protein
MRFLTLMVRHGADKYSTAIEDVSGLFARQLPSVDWDLVVIDNTLPEGHEEQLGPNRTLIGGSNAQWEFSSWDNGIAHVGSRLADYDLVNLATASFRRLNPRYLNRIDEDILRLAFFNGAEDFLAGRYVIGHIDYYNDVVVIFEKPSQAWFRSAFLLLPPDELQTLGSLVSVTDEAALFSEEPAAPFREDAPLSLNFQKYLLESLTRNRALTADTLPIFQRHVVQLLNEHLLTSRMRGQGCTILDGSWLATRAESLLPVNEPLGMTPRWMSQVTTAGIRLPVSEDSSAA